MKEKDQDYRKLNDINRALDKAIDTMNVTEIEAYLQELDELRGLSSSIQDSKLFAKKIIKENRKGNEYMMRNNKKIGTMVASLSLALIVGGGTLYATGIYKSFTFFGKETTTTVKSTSQELSEKEMEEMAKEASESYGEPITADTNSIEMDKKTYSSIEAIKAELGIDISIPSYIPKDFVMEQEITVESLQDPDFGKEENVYVVYKSEESENRFFGISVMKQQLGEEKTVITTTDSVYKEDYTNAFGDHYKLYDEDGGIIALTTIGDIDYALVFMGVSDEDIHKTIDSVDLSVYR